ncbi:MAG: hypothetical protein M0Z80_15870 [Treponema sp.]|nr:hypothetical protein [Treponema sp.]
MRNLVLALTLAALGAALSAQAAEMESAGGTFHGKLAFVAGSPVLDTGDGMLMLVMPRFYYYSYSSLFAAGATAVVRGISVSLAAAPGRGGERYLVVEAITIAGKTFTIYRRPGAGIGAAAGGSGSPAGAAFPAPAGSAQGAGPSGAGSGSSGPGSGPNGSGSGPGSGSSGPGGPGSGKGATPSAGGGSGAPAPGGFPGARGDSP